MRWCPQCFPLRKMSFTASWIFTARPSRTGRIISGCIIHTIRQSFVHPMTMIVISGKSCITTFAKEPPPRSCTAGPPNISDSFCCLPQRLPCFSVWWFFPRPVLHPNRPVTIWVIRAAMTPDGLPFAHPALSPALSPALPPALPQVLFPDPLPGSPLRRSFPPLPSRLLIKTKPQRFTLRPPATNTTVTAVPTSQIAAIPSLFQML